MAMASSALRALRPALLRHRALAAPLPPAYTSFASSSAASLGRHAAAMHTSAARRANVAGVPPNLTDDPQLGDYRNPPFESRQSRRHDPRWWDKQEKANFGETLHEQEDLASVWAPDVHAMDPHKALFQLLVALGVLGSVTLVIYVTLPDKPAQPRTFPRDGLKEELGSIAAPAYGAFDIKKQDDEEDDGDDDE